MSARAKQNDRAERRRALHLYVCLMRASAAVTRRVHEHLAEDSLTISQFAVLEALLHLGPQSQRALGGKILKSDNNLTTVVDNLERRGLVRRTQDPSDRRIKLVVLTGSGEHLIRRVFERHADVVTGDLSTLSAGEKRTLSGLLRKLGRREERQ